MSDNKELLAPKAKSGLDQRVSAGKINGHTATDLVAMAESQMAPVADEAIDKKALEASTEGG